MGVLHSHCSKDVDSDGGGTLLGAWERARGVLSGWMFL